MLYVEANSIIRNEWCTTLPIHKRTSRADVTARKENAPMGSKSVLAIVCFGALLHSESAQCYTTSIIYSVY